VHELALCGAIARIVGNRAGERAVSTVRLRIGELRQVVPDTLTYCWTMVTESTPLAGSVLDIERVVARGRCDGCGAEHDLGAELDFGCPSCGAPATTVIAGEEFLVTSIDVATTSGAVP
jgi:hydrogenase nickel incorporation protein HypA/HybF